MWWIVFTAVDLYVGLIVLDALIPSLAAEKRGRAIIAKKVFIVLLGLLVIWLAVILIQRWHIHS